MLVGEAFESLVSRLRSQEEGAAADVFRCFVHRLSGLVRQRLPALARAKVDPEDIVQSVFGSFFRRFRDGQFYLRDWDGLWALLSVMAVRKCAARVEHLQASGRDLRREVSLSDLDFGSEAYRSLWYRGPSPEQSAALEELVRGLLSHLNELEREIVCLHLQAHTVPEISRYVGRAERTVWRTLAKVRQHLLRIA